MRLISKLLFYSFLTFIFIAFVACSSKPRVLKEKNLGIGDTPTLPQLNQPGEKSRNMLVNLKDQQPPVTIPPANARIEPNASNSIALMSSSGGLLTIWALKADNWVWGYTPIDSYEFGNARFWRILSYPNGQVQIKNVKQNTCLKGYKNGVIHSVCSTKDLAQFWNINFFDNQAIQIQNVAKKTCLQTPTSRSTTYYSIYLTKCATSKEKNLDQQWYITPETVPSDPIFVTNPS